MSTIDNTDPSARTPKRVDAPRKGKSSARGAALATALVCGIGAGAPLGLAVFGPAPAAPATPPSHIASVSAPALAAVVTPNTLYATTAKSPVVVLGPSGSLALPAGFFIAPVAPGSEGVSAVAPAASGGGSSVVSNPSLSFAPTTVSQSTSASGEGGAATTLATSGPTALATSASLTSATPNAASGPTGFGLFSPTGALLGLIGPGGLLIGDGVLPGQNGGLLIGNGAGGGPGQRGGNGGLLFGNGGDGGTNLLTGDGGDGGNAG